MYSIFWYYEKEVYEECLAIERARDRYLERGYSPEWINSRVKSITYHSQLLDEWANRGATTKEYEKLSNTISKETFGVTTQEHKDLKNVADGFISLNDVSDDTFGASIEIAWLNDANNLSLLDAFYEDKTQNNLTSLRMSLLEWHLKSLLTEAVYEEKEIEVDIE